MKRFDLSKTSGKLYRWALRSMRRREGVLFDMNIYIRRTKKSPHGVCGTAACAAGHLAFDPAFRKLGVTKRRGPTGAGYWSSFGIAELLGITPSEADHITMPSEYGPEHKTTRDGIKKRAVKRRILALAASYAALGQ